MVGQTNALAELGRHGLTEVVRHQQSRHLVLVLVGHHTEQLRCHGGRQILRQHLLRFFHQRGELERVRSVPVRLQATRAVLDQLRQSLGSLWRLLALEQLCSQGRIARQMAPDPKGFEVFSHRRAVELNRLFDIGARQWNAARLPGHAQQHQVGEDGIAQYLGCNFCGRQGDDTALTHPATQTRQQITQRRRPVTRLDEFGGRRTVFVDDGQTLDPEARQRGAAAGHHRIGTDEQITLPRRNAGRRDIFVAGRELHIGIDGSALLRHAGHVHHARRLAFQMCGHAQQRTDGHDARATHTAHDDANRCLELLHVRRLGPALGQSFKLRRTLHILGVHRHETGAETIDTREVLVAAALVDLPFGSQRGLNRLHRQTVRLLGAVSTAFANLAVDVGPLVWVWILIALAAAAFFARTGLRIDQRRHARYLAQLALHIIELAAMTDRDAGRDSLVFAQQARLVGDDDLLTHALGRKLSRELRNTQLPIHMLSARHAHGVVIKNLVGDVDLGRDRLANRQITRVEIGPVADVGEHMLLVGEVRRTHPACALSAHLREGFRAAVHRERQKVATNTTQRPAAFGQYRRRIVRTTAAEIGLALGDVDHPARLALGVVQLVDPLLDELLQVLGQLHAQKTRRQHFCNRLRLQFIVADQRRILDRSTPLTMSIRALPDDAWARMVWQRIQLVLDL